jgi:pyridoxamine 5'-phosphate oxidase
MSRAMSDALTDPIALFLAVRGRCEATEPWGATAGVLATADARGRPSARFVLVKEVEADGFYFYTNERSRKARELAANPWAALCFYWPSARVQFRIEGPVERVSAARSDAYFASRPRLSQLGAWASEQSHPIDSREELERRVRALEAQYAGVPIPRPPHWGGYRLVPATIEHWIEGNHRLHDRFLYEREGAGWKRTRLCP